MRAFLCPVILLAFVSVFCLETVAYAQNTKNFPTLGEVVRNSPKLDRLIAPGTKIEVVSSGFDWSEGPVWVPAMGKSEGHLLFSDIPHNKVVKWVEGKGITTFLQPSGYTGPGRYSRESGSNGLALDLLGRLVSCEHGDRRISLLTRGGGKRTVADNYQGQRFNSPNDLVIKSNGDIYFTDPPYGLPREKKKFREIDFCGVYRISKNGTVTLLTKELTKPNGIGFSPDEKTLYVAQSDPASAIWKSYPVKEDGTLGAGRVFYDATPWVGKQKGLPDGLAVDQTGNLFASGPGGISVFSPDGEVLGRIDTGEATSNCTFGGPDNSILYMTADMYLCRISTKTRGLKHKTTR